MPPTALLICMENTYWSRISRDDDFVKSFKKSFALYVESGMRKKVEAEIDVLINELESGCRRVGKDFEARFYKIIIEHCLRKFHSSCFYLHLKCLTTVTCRLNTAHPQAEDQASELERRNGEAEPKNKRKFIWLQNFLPKFRRG